MSSSNTPGSGSSSGREKRETWLDRQWERITGFDVLREYAEASDLDMPSGWYDRPEGSFRFLQGPNGKIIAFSQQRTQSYMSYIDVHGILPKTPSHEAARTQITMLLTGQQDDEMVSRLARGLRLYDDEFAQRS